MKMFSRTGEVRWLDMCRKTWGYIKSNIVDIQGGDWYWSRLPDGSVNRKEDKAGFWKCPYHNGRMCIELINEHADD
jgi:mannobiose 2-epimerase